MQIDEEQTVNNVRDFLGEYELLNRISKRPDINLESPTISDMPKGSSHGNANQEKIVSRIDAQVYVSNIQKVLKLVQAENDTYFQIIKFCYIHPMIDDSPIWDRLNMSKATFYRDRTKALVCFAAYCPPMPNFKNPKDAMPRELLVYKN